MLGLIDEGGIIVAPVAQNATLAFRSAPDADALAMQEHVAMEG